MKKLFGWAVVAIILLAPASIVRADSLTASSSDALSVQPANGASTSQATTATTGAVTSESQAQLNGPSLSATNSLLASDAAGSVSSDPCVAPASLWKRLNWLWIILLCGLSIAAGVVLGMAVRRARSQPAPVSEAIAEPAVTATAKPVAKTTKKKRASKHPRR